jgi:hypothetical protein
MQKASAGQTLGSHGKKQSGRRGITAMSDDYCLHPDLCGIGQDCSECHQNHVQQLKAKIVRLRECLTNCTGNTVATDTLRHELLALQDNSDE